MSLCENCRVETKAKGPAGKVDPSDPRLWDKPLWCVYGPECFPTVIACKVNNASGMGAAIWGYSVYKRKPGYRTLGQDLKRWVEEKTEEAQGDEPVFFDIQLAAFDYLRGLVTPKVSAA